MQKKQEICELQHKLRTVEAERDAVLEDLVSKEDQLLQQDGKLTMLSQALKQSEDQIATQNMHTGAQPIEWRRQCRHMGLNPRAIWAAT